MKILVTGGAGYIGSHVAKALRDSDRDVVVLDNLSTGREDLVPKGVEFVKGDVGDIILMRKLLPKVDAVLHFAAFVQVEESMGKGGREKYFSNNAEKTKTLLQAVAECGVKHFVFSSTAAVYGNPATLPVDEDAPLNPESNYGASKVAAEGFVRETVEGTHYVILRYFNVVGADPQGECGYRLDIPPTHLIRRALEVARGARDHLDVYGTDYRTPDGSGVRDYIHIADLTSAHLAALKYLENDGKSVTLNCGYGRGFSVFEVHQAAQNVTGKRIPLRYGARRAGDPASIVADCSKIRAVLGWTPQHNDLDTIIADQWRWETKKRGPA